MSYGLTFLGVSLYSHLLFSLKMAGILGNLVSRAKHGKGIWRSLCRNSLESAALAPTSHRVTPICSHHVSRSCKPKDVGVLTMSAFLFRTASSASCRSHAGFSYRGYAAGAALENSSKFSTAVRYLTFACLMVGSGLATYYFYPKSLDTLTPESLQEVHTMSNWSNTHEVQTDVYIQPESLEELERVVQKAHEHKQKIRAVGSGLSPNGIGFCSEGMLNLALMDEILSVDKELGRVTVQAGARVEQVVGALKPYGLTLQNYASIKEQQIGGFIQVGAHGTGAMLPPVDEQVVSLKLVTPAKGTLDLSPDSDPELFYFARCGLGALGVVAEVTLQCVPRHCLLEYTFVTDKEGVQKNHKKWLNENKHLRYMWIPDTDTVVVIQCNPLQEGKEAPKVKQVGDDEKLKHVREIYKEIATNYRPPNLPNSSSEERQPELISVEKRTIPAEGSAAEQEREKVQFLSDSELSELSFFELRDVLIAIDPLNREHIIRVNKAEAEFWKCSEGYRTGWSDEILGFDCGGQQWVSEVAFPVGTLKKPDMKDVKYMEEVFGLIKKENIPAPSPIEQRWTSSSKSPLSLASSASPDTLFSWVGIIMYLPTGEVQQRAAITKSFFEYRKALQTNLWDRFDAHEHWAKTEIPTDEDSLHWVQQRLRNRFSVEVFNRLRSELDPNHILTNYQIEQLFPL